MNLNVEGRRTKVQCNQLCELCVAIGIFLYTVNQNFFYISTLRSHVTLSALDNYKPNTYIVPGSLFVM